MNPRPLVIITSRLPPEVCGIGTYSWLLQRHWPISGSRAQFFVIDGAAQSTAELGHSAITEFDQDPEKLAQALIRSGDGDVLLHYAGRAYHRYGCPTWLPPVLRAWKAKSPAGRLLIFFHELPSDNFAITSRYFWMDLCNRRVIRKLADLADVIVTNTSEHATELQKISGRKEVHVIPVGSNIEPIGDSSEQRARTEFAVFGLPFGRLQTLQAFDHDIRSWHENGQLTKLHLIGPRDEKFDPRSERLIATWPTPGVVVRHGLLSSAEVSQLLSQVRFGLTNATTGNWSKSTAFMAYAAHDCAIVSKAKSESAPLCFTIAPNELATISDVDLIARRKALQKWYDGNAGWNAIATKVAALLRLRVEKEALP
jgi:hypothetical protein